MRFALLVGMVLATQRVHACPRSIEIRLAPVANLQMAVWIEDAGGAFVDTVYVTRSTGMLGLANRPGNPRFKSDYRWPYGAREMVLPIWAHARGRSYGRVVMGGASGLDDNDTIGNHFPISSPEPFYCSPSGGVGRTIDGVDTVSCASPFFGCKGMYAPSGSSVYPPRADLVDFTDHDAQDAKRFAADNDIAVVSGATPPGGSEIAPPLLWSAPDALPDGDYRVRVEASLEADFDAAHRYPSVPDDDAKLTSFGHDVLGQPSLLWEARFTLDAAARVASADAYAGYGDWDGASGAVHPPDGTIATGVDGSGAGRLLEQSDQHDGLGAWRVKVSTSGCAGTACATPEPPTGLAATPADTTVALSFTAPLGALRPARYDVRYRIGAPLTDDGFALGTPGDMAPAPAGPGAPQSLTVSGLTPDSDVWLGLRAVVACGRTSPAAIVHARTAAARFTTLHGCFVATAAYGSPLAAELRPLRALRDRHLLGNPLGGLAVALYYAFSPPLARAIAVDDGLRAAARAALAPLVEWSRAALE
jgi:hypothetical protein